MHQTTYLKVKRSKNLKGEVRLPRSKTHAFKALILSCLANGTSYIRQPKISNDWHQAVRALKMYGAKIEETEKNVYKIEGVNGNLQTPCDVIDVSNSGTMLAYACAVAALCNGWSVITGDESIRTLRKVSKNLFEPFKELGIEIISTKSDGMAPFVIKGKIKGGIAHMDGTGCQPVYTVLTACAFSEKPVELFVRTPGEKGYVESLLYWFRKIGIQYENVKNKYEHYKFMGNKPPEAFDCTIPFEMSAPPYPLLAAILAPDSEIIVKGIDLDEDPYSDKQVITILRDMGGDITYKNKVLTARTSKLHGIEVDMNDLPDQVPTIAVAACFAKGKTVIKNALTARWKECDRISAICKELQKMGGKVIEKKDGLIIDQDGTWKLKGTSLNGYYDHRMVMSLAIAGLNSDSETIISDAQMVEKSFETFIPDMQKTGANFKLTEKI